MRVPVNRGRARLFDGINLRRVLVLWFPLPQLYFGGRQLPVREQPTKLRYAEVADPE